MNLMNFQDWIERKYLDYRGDAYGNDRSITEFAEFIGVGHSLLSEWMSGKKKPGASSISKIARKYPEVYGVLGMPSPESDQLDERRFKKAFRETLGEYRARQISLDDPEAEKIAIEIFERNGLIYNRTENDD